MKLRHGVAALVLVLALAGCGGDESSSVGADSAATIAPATAVAYASVNTDVESDQWRQADELLSRFPGRAKLLDFLRSSLADEGVDWETELKPALGPTIEVVALGFESGDDVVGLAQPADEAKFRQLLEEGEDAVVVRDLEGWTIFADSEAALDRFEQARGDETLSSRDDFEALMGELPDEALAKAWVDTSRAGSALAGISGGSALQSSVGKPVAAAAALEAVDEGVRLVAEFRNEDVTVEGRDFGELAERIPADALAFVNFHGQDGQLKATESLRGLPQAEMGLGQLESLLGVTLEDVTSLFNREILLWVRPGTIIPEVTLVLEVENEADAKATVDKLVAAASGAAPLERRARRVGDVDATELDLGQFSVLYGTVDGKLVLTTQPSGFEALTGDGDRLLDSDAYEGAVEAAGVSDGENVVLWADVQRIYQLVQTLAALGDEPVPPEVSENLEPLRAIVFSMDPSFEEGTARLFVHVR